MASTHRGSANTESFDNKALSLMEEIDAQQWQGVESWRKDGYRTIAEWADAFGCDRNKASRTLATAVAAGKVEQINAHIVTRGQRRRVRVFRMAE